MNRKFILIYRLCFVALSWFTIITGWILAGFPGIFVGLKYFTMQTNLMIVVWWTLAILWYNKPETLEKITGKIKGAFTLYITVTFLVFAIALSFLYHPTGFAAFSNYVLHYIAPIAFIVDWVLTETEVTYEWKYILYWVVYPLGYLTFAMIHGAITKPADYLYPFLNVSEMGTTFFAIAICLLVVVFLGLSSLYIFINRKWLAKGEP